MKTIIYNEILFRAAEAAGRTRDNLPPAEAALLKSVFAHELPRVWYSEAWSELCPRPLPAVTVDPATHSFPLAQSGFEIGEVLRVFSQDPDGNAPYVKLQFSKGDGVVFIHPPAVYPNNVQPFPVPGTVYPYYISLCPDLLAITDATALANTALPLFLGNWLALRGAAALLAADGAIQLAAAQKSLADDALDFQRTRIVRPPWATTQ
jgi:hypothetical protein